MYRLVIRTLTGFFVALFVMKISVREEGKQGNDSWKRM